MDHSHSVKDVLCTLRRGYIPHGVCRKFGKDGLGYGVISMIASHWNVDGALQVNQDSSQEAHVDLFLRCIRFDISLSRYVLI